MMIETSINEEVGGDDHLTGVMYVYIHLCCDNNNPLSTSSKPYYSIRTDGDLFVIMLRPFFVTGSIDFPQARSA